MNKLAYLVLLGIMVLWSCGKMDPIQDNPLDPGNPEYDPPSVHISVGPAEGEIIDTSAITFQWESNEQARLYRFQFDTNEWSGWTDAKSQTFDYLDEGKHAFIVQSSFLNGDTSEVASRNFIVDAVKGPALMFYPRRHIASVGDTVTFQILAEEVNSLTAAQFTITYDPNILEIVSVDQGSIFTGYGESIFHEERNSGEFSVLTALLGGETSYVGGTGDLLSVMVKAKQKGSTNLDFDGSELFKDPKNNNIVISEIIGGLVTTK